MPETERLRAQLRARLPGFAHRVAQAQAIITEGLAAMARPYIAFSTGKDSLVMAHLIWEQDATVPAVYFDADCAYPETLALLDRMEAVGRPIIRWPCEPMLDTFARLGGPDAPGVENETMRTTVYRPAKAIIAAHGYDGVFVGLRMEESRARHLSGIMHGNLFHLQRDGIMECRPVLRWTYDDIWAYIVSRDLDYNRAYDRMWELPEANRRVSYWAGETNIQFGRWVFLRQHYPELWNRFCERFPEARAYA